MTPDINQTALVPYLIAEKVAGGNNTPAVEYLVERAENCYKYSLHFRCQLHKRGADSRVVLSMFMEHWLMGFETNKSK